MLSPSQSPFPEEDPGSSSVSSVQTGFSLKNYHEQISEESHLGCHGG